MPELPEVETTRRGIEPHLLNQVVADVIVRNANLRWPVSPEISELIDQKINQLERRAKYIIIHTNKGKLLLHLGMSGSLRICQSSDDHRKHDHLIIQLTSGKEMRLHDPRRFGCALWTKEDIQQHALIKNLGPEPLADEFTADYLAEQCARSKASIKSFIMQSKVVVGVGNIYACESLFRAGIHPTRAANKVSSARLDKLHRVIREVLAEAIKQGGTTLRDFVNASGQPGYFKQSLDVYDREGDKCHQCQKPIKRIVLGQRSTYYCGHCQK